MQDSNNKTAISQVRDTDWKLPSMLSIPETVVLGLI